MTAIAFLQQDRAGATFGIPSILKAKVPGDGGGFKFVADADREKRRRRRLFLLIFNPGDNEELSISLLLIDSSLTGPKSKLKRIPQFEDKNFVEH